jgi:hypothetical protein
VEERESEHFDHELFFHSMMQSMNFNIDSENVENDNSQHAPHAPFENDTHLHSLSCSMSLHEFHSSVKKK